MVEDGVGKGAETGPKGFDLFKQLVFHVWSLLDAELAWRAAEGPC